MVHPFNDGYDPISGVNITNADFAVDVNNGSTYILQVNQALDFLSTMDDSLLSMNQCRYNGVVVEDIPEHIDLMGTSNFRVYFPDENVTLPLQMANRALVMLLVRYPSDLEMNTC